MIYNIKELLFTGLKQRKAYFGDTQYQKMIETALSLVFTYRYVVLYPIAIIEGPIIAILSGSLAANHQLNFFSALFIIVFGDITGDSFYYCLGRFGRQRLISRWGHLIGLNSSRVAKLDKYYESHAARSLILGKLAFSFEIPVLISAGIARYSYPKFIILMALGALPKTLVLMTIGFVFGFSLETAKRDISNAGRLSLTVVGLIIAYLIIKWFSRRRLKAVHGYSASGRKNRSQLNK